MKKVILPAIFALALAACNTDTKDIETSRAILMTDTVNMQQGTSSTDVAAPEAPQAAPAPRPQVVYVDRYVQAPAPRRAPQPRPVATPAATPDVAPLPAPTTNNLPPAPGNGDVAVNSPIGNDLPETDVEEKKGMSNSAKGAIIGGVGGAVAGAVIGKNVKGAAIGGAVGAIGGYILGKKKDNNNK